MDKTHLRQKYKRKRRELSIAQYRQANEKIWKRFKDYLKWDGLKAIHLYLAVESKREVSTRHLVNYLWQYHPQVKVVVPLVKNETELDHSILYPESELEANLWGIPEPSEIVPFKIDELTVVVVPLLAFDFQGNRLGYGKGHYDRFLAQCPALTEKIGLSLFPPWDKIPVESSDVPLNTVICPHKIYRFQDQI